jgi:conjugal transfer pilus assembly protein TraE
MEHSARLNSNRIIAIGFIVMALLIAALTVAVIIMAINNYRLQNEKQVVAVPMLFKAPFGVSQNSADASYLEQMALSFVALRLNVTPETVNATHSTLLMMVKPAAQNALKIVLAEEANRIRASNVNAAFFQTSVKVYPAQGRVDIRGELRTWIGDSAPEKKLKHYSLYIDRSEGVTWLAKFVEVNDEN